MKEEVKQTYRQVGRFMSLGIALVLCTVIGLMIGFYLDKWLGTKPWLLLIFLFLGISAGFFTLYREVKSYTENNKN
ncbi:MAG: hypothetical protein A2161_19560 [Candidatus Schekmanbacteria bacterium RBG_13_48_7]|uniref:Magnesium transporter n=1 Tax=Candidatus Schekmanbacteria bacterium RBG_13_48_7 TaxID=1817878 RepID=A0A1F7S2D1_9BACT|nr:MAG: hypothetical protein A2161_19560 [Candidatus Schekmanbacteria bacterium RBG_13_48_7]